MPCGRVQSFEIEKEREREREKEGVQSLMPYLGEREGGGLSWVRRRNGEEEEKGKEEKEGGVSVAVATKIEI